MANPADDDPVELWPQPDMGVLRLNRREPPALPLDAFGPWAKWITEAAEAAACPVDFVAAPLLASSSALIGNARWARALPGWEEPPHLWIGVVGDSGTGKSPGADCLMRYVLPEIEKRMLADFPDQLREWRAANEARHAADGIWKDEVKAATKGKRPPPLPPAGACAPEPQSPRLRQHDVTIEKVAELLGTAAPKGLLIIRDELMGWIGGMNAYHDAGRSFWVESYGGRPYRVERKSRPEPIIVPRNVVAVYGSTQPDKIASMLPEADDGLLARPLWVWPDPVEFRLSQIAPRSDWAIAALDRLRELDLQHQPGEPSRPGHVPLAPAALPLLEMFGRAMQERQATVGDLLRSAYGKARGQAVRLALNLEMLWWCGADGMDPPPVEISECAFTAAAGLLNDYFMPMAERTYGDSGASKADRLAAVLARWIVQNKPSVINTRKTRREAALPGLRQADDMKIAIDVLVDADWLIPAPSRHGSGPGRQRIDYLVNPRLKNVKPA